MVCDAYIYFSAESGLSRGFEADFRARWTMEPGKGSALQWVALLTRNVLFWSEKMELPVLIKC